MASSYKEIKEYKAPTYQEQYGQQIADLADKVANREEFSYDYETDPAYQSLAKTYQRLGDRAREDTMGDYASMTGGMPSTAAVTAGQQAQNDYNQQLTDKIPALMEAAYGRYKDDYAMNLEGLQAFQGLEDSRYSRFATDRDYNRGVYESNRDYRWNKHTWNKEFNWGKYTWNKEFQHQVEQDNRAYKQWLKEFNFNKWNSKFDHAMQIWQTKGKATSYVSKILGVPKGATTESYYFNKLSYEQSKKSSSSRGSGGGHGRGGRSRSSSSSWYGNGGSGGSGNGKNGKSGNGSSTMSENSRRLLKGAAGVLGSLAPTNGALGVVSEVLNQALKGDAKKKKKKKK